MNNFFIRLKEERTKLGLNQTQFAEQTGVKKLTQSNYETGKRKPDVEYLALAEKLGCDVQYIVTGQRSFSDDFDFSIQKRAIDIVAKYIQRSDRELLHPELFYPVAMEIYQIIKQAEDSGQEIDPIEMGTKVIPLFVA